MRALPSLLLAALVIASSAFEIACKSRPGEGCTGNREACMDDHTALICHMGRFVPVKCPGESGCKENKDSARVLCDISGAGRGEECSLRQEGESVCRPDKKAMITCRDSKFQHVACRGPKGCVSYDGPSGAMVKVCDNTLVPIGAACTLGELKGQSCSEDGKALVSCEGGRFAILRYCRGPGGCKPTAESTDVTCDESVLPEDE